MVSIPERTDGDGGFGRTLLSNVAGAVGLVLGSALVFGGIGMFDRAESPDIVVADHAPGAGSDTAGGPEPGSTAQEGDGAEDDDTDQTGQVADGEPSGDDASPDTDDRVGDDEDGGDEDGGDATEPSQDATEADDKPAEPDDQPAEPDDSSDEAPDASSVDPASIDLQVLDGYQQDGGAAAARVADELRAAGYRVIAENPALRYEVTTVLWSPGGEDRARQVAAEIGASEVREQPGTLSDSVAVHVVVGSDRG